MTLTSRTRLPWMVIAILVAAGCGGSDTAAPTPTSTALLGVAPLGGSTGISTASPMTITFSGAMMPGIGHPAAKGVVVGQPTWCSA